MPALSAKPQRGALPSPKGPFSLPSLPLSFPLGWGPGVLRRFGSVPLCPRVFGPGRPGTRRFWGRFAVRAPLSKSQLAREKC